MDIIFEEKVSGAAKDREQLQKMLEDLREGDIIYVKDLIPITCSTRNLFELINLTQSKKLDKNSFIDFIL